MIPVKLTIEGLYSYQDRQTIDFTNLTDAGLFGIFGAVGSGKSSILEAISYVLYGETERLNAREKRTYNMMNLKSNRTYIEFEFYNHEDKLFMATLELKRNTKKFEEVRSPNRVFYEQKQNEWVPLEHLEAEKILGGLSYDNFKRTIIIPQGQFKEFLELKDTERTQMMKDIFQLHRFDLQDKVSELRKENTSQTDQLEGQLKGYDSVSEEQIKQKETDLHEAKNSFNTTKKEYDLINENYQQLRHLKKDADDLTTKKEELGVLSKKKEDIHLAQSKLDEYERVSGIFARLIMDFEKAEKQRQSNQTELKEATGKEKEQNATLKKREELLKDITPYFENLPQKKAEENDLAFIAQALESAGYIQRLNHRTEKGNALITQTGEEEKKIQSVITEKEGMIPALNAARLDASLLLDIGNWYHQHQNLSKSRQDQVQKTAAEKEKIELIIKELASKNIRADIYEKEFIKQLDILKETRLRLENQRSQLEVHQKLAQYKTALHEGDPCPLCGSTDHPHIMEADDVTDELRQILEKIKETDNERENVVKRQTEAEKLMERKKLLEQNLQSEEEQLRLLTQQTEEHLADFIWTDYDPENPEKFQKKKEETTAADKQITELNNQLDKLRKEKEKQSNNLKKYQKALDEIRQEQATKQGQYDSLINNLKTLQFKDFEQKSVAEVGTMLDSLKKKNTEIEVQHQSLTREINQLNTAIASTRSTLESLNKRSLEIETEITTLTNHIEQSLQEQKITDIQVVKNILAQQLNIQEERNRIQQFNIQYETLRSAVNALETKLNEANFSNEKFQETEMQWKEEDKKLKEANDKVVKLQAETEQLKKSFDEKKKLLVRYDELKKRGDNLQIMYNLFRGSGFVEYISSIYLSQLCDHANVRFHRMTRNRLSLQLGTNNDFEIIDYLNEGRSRSVKTLSGGQSFQVSLSLALALAESVQAHAKADKNFFFIDEGFGTQDADSINIIFETLVNLNRENKIVGIISHVEELKDRIPRSLTVVNDPEKGSRIYAND